MTIKRTARTRLTILLTGLAVTAAGLTLGANLPPQGVGAPTPPPTVCEEDMPCWDCSENDDACADGDAKDAWDTWVKAEGARQLKVDPSRPYRVDFMAATPDYPQNMDTYDLALPGTTGKWYVFRASYTDKSI